MIHVFCEGDEKIFIEQLLSEWGIHGDVTSTNGWNSLSNIAFKLKSNTDKGERNLIVFDSDSDFDSRRDELLRIREELDISFELFLFPNNADAGEFEDLLLALIPEQNLSITNCFDEYNSCIAGLGMNPAPSLKKAKVYAYLEAMGKEVQNKKRNYLDETVWRIDAGPIQPLREFLSQE